MSGRWPFTAEKIATRLNLIRPFIYRKSAPLPHFRLLPLPEAMVDAPICADPSGWEEIEHESYWGRSDLNFVLKSNFRVPDGWGDQNLAIRFPLGVMGDIFNHPEALVHIDGVPVGSADRYHHSITLNPSMVDGRDHLLSLHGWTGHAGWPPDPNSRAKLFMGKCEIVQRDPLMLAFYRLSASVLDVVRTLGDSDPVAEKLLAALDKAFIALDTRDPLNDRLYDSLPNAAAILRAGIDDAGKPLPVTLHGIGHAHMDIAYLWPISQIRLKNARTYSNVLRLMDADPHYKFSHSQPQLYEYTRQDYPQIFERIKERVKEGRWEVMGGMWVEPDLNIPGAEALVRQIMLGRAYFEEHFGDVETPALWLPDTFGFPGQVPQLMKHAGLSWFVTNKLNWNQRNRIPSTSHVWEGIDGTQVVTHVLTTPRPVQYLPFPTNYKSDLTAPEVLGTWIGSSAPDSVRDLPVCYGYGDGGGGPTEDLLARAHIYSDMPGMPRFKMSTVRDVLEKIQDNVATLPVWKGEHYLEGHRGTLTSQGWIKRANRKAEWALHNAEALCAMAGVQPDLKRAWELLCLNQFHDIITGTSVAEVFVDARRDFEEISQLARECADQAVAQLPSSEPFVANLAPVSGPRLALLDESHGAAGQKTEVGTLAFFPDMPSYSLVPLSACGNPEGMVTASLEGDKAILENSHVRVELNERGELQSVFDKAANRSVLGDRHIGNVLQVFEDRPICWDAWDIDPFIEDRMEKIDTVSELEVVESGPLRASIRVVRRWRNSEVSQEIRLRAHSPRIDFVTKVDWHESHTLLKASFPTSVSARTAHYDIQWGRMERATARESEFDLARYEVAAHKWACLTDGDYAVALLNDCKYGYDVRDNTIRITLIKSATYPDPNADQGMHEFTYSLLSLPQANMRALDYEAYDLNVPLAFGGRNSAPEDGVASLGASLVASSNPAVIVETIKPAEDGDGLIVRVFENRGSPASSQLTFSKTVLGAERVNFLERWTEDLPVADGWIDLELQPFEIVSLRVRFR
ncbi:MAG: glycoside hydrolase family 38 C-terminal domain-containing protein [Pseudomonadota bacterium]